ncbi:MAG TPA: tetratricopeptide repeat protein [Blastocatellia bacterium]|nr:tetratricopeptide repeat protein [Blastocatellia bacterium]
MSFRLMVLLLTLACVLPVAAAQTAREQMILQIQELMQQNRPTEAHEALNAALRKYPGDAGLENLLGIIEAQAGNYPAAEAAFKRAITRMPKFTGAYLNLGRLYQENSGRDPSAPQKALLTYQRLLQFQPDNPEANYQCAVLLQLRGQYAASLQYLSRLPADYQGRATVLAVRCANFAGLGKPVQAAETARQLALHPDFSEPDVFSILPALTDELGVRLLEALLARERATTETLHRLGLLYERQGRLVEARQALEKSIGGSPPSAGLLLELARVAYQQQDYKGALGYLAHARDLEPRNAAIHYSFGMSCIRLRLVAEAHVSFGRAVELEPDNPQYNYAMGAASAYRRDPAEAIPYLQKYLRLKPQDAQGHLLLGAVYFRSGDYQAARSELLAAMKRRETAAGAHYFLGRVARQEGRIDEAVRELELTLQAAPQHADALAELGQCRLQQKDYAAAEESLQRALAIDPENYAANFNLLVLYSRTRDKREAAQAQWFEEIKKLRTDKEQEFLRAIEIRPD